jgi:hypothetical protein
MLTSKPPTSKTADRRTTALIWGTMLLLRHCQKASVGMSAGMKCLGDHIP